MDSKFLGKDQFIWWQGVVEDRKDPIMLGRARIRIFGWHSEDRLLIPTAELPWAMPSIPLDNGRNSVGLKEGDWVWGFFADGPEAQRPIVVGYIPGIDEKASDINMGFGDPTRPEDIGPKTHPRPPDLAAQAAVDPLGEADDDKKPKPAPKKTSMFFDRSKVPGSSSVFGDLAKKFDPKNYKLDLNKDGLYDAGDAGLIITNSIGLFKSSLFGAGSLLLLKTIGIPTDWFFGLFNSNGTKKKSSASEIAIPGSPYPLQDRLMEPTTSRLARNEKTEDTIVSVKKSGLKTMETAGYDSSGVGVDSPSPPEMFEEPKTAYNATYPFNHVYESESGHVVEIDDSPGAERLHWYHRSGTFREIHPDGTQVTKVKKSDYTFVIEDYFLSSTKNIHMSAQEEVTIKGTTGIILNTDMSLKQEIRENLTTHVHKDTCSRIGGGAFTVIADQSWSHVADGAYFCVTDGELHVKALMPIVIESEDRVQIKSKIGIDLCAPKVTMQGFGGGLTSVNMVSVDIKSLWLMSNMAMFALPGYPAIPNFSFPQAVIQNKAEDKSWYTETAESASLKYGFLIPEGGVGTVWKPISDSDKNLVTLSVQQVEHKLFEAIPTGELEAAYVKYAHPNGDITEWKVVRPKHIRGAEITNKFGAPRQDTFLDGRRMYRWPRPGKDYPKQLIWDIVGTTDAPGSDGPMIIGDPAVRHQCIASSQVFDRVVPEFDVTKPSPSLQNDREKAIEEWHKSDDPNKGTATDYLKERGLISTETQKQAAERTDGKEDVDYVIDTDNGERVYFDDEFKKEVEAEAITSTPTTPITTQERASDVTETRNERTNSVSKNNSTYEGAPIVSQSDKSTRSKKA